MNNLNHMKKYLLVICLALFTLTKSEAQIKTYSTSETEFIFSFADYEKAGESVNTPLRFSCFFHLGNEYHVDFNKNVGLFTGYGLRNVGFTSSEGDSTIKRRNYYFGVPLALKLGNFDNGLYLYGGAEAELALNYKEKLFVSGKKVESAKFNTWFSDRTPLFMPSVFFGLNTKSGMNLKIRYYLQDFYNRNFTENGIKIYDKIEKSQVFYFSIGWRVKNKADGAKPKAKQTFNKEA